jgi:nucleotide-binding universal stress UspA family protein
MKNILVAYDFSEEANNALEYSAAAASVYKLDLILFSVYRFSIHALNARIDNQGLQHLLDTHQQKLEGISEYYRKRYDIIINIYMATGDFFDEIQRCTDIHHPDFVVMGMIGKSIEQDLLGNTVTASIHKLKYPVIAIPESARFEGIKNILFACDITRGVHGEILQRVRDIAHRFSASVEVFHVSKRLSELKEDALENLNTIHQSLSGVNYYFKNVASDMVIGAIKKEIEASKADILIMVPYKYGFWDSLIHRSKTRIMASGNSIPLLSIPL